MRSIKKTKRKTKKLRLPKYVVVKFDPPEWHVRRLFATTTRDAKGRIKYIQVTRRCWPETAERAEQISSQIEREFYQVDIETEDLKSVSGFLSEFLATKKVGITRRTFEDYDYLKTRYVDDTAFGISPIEEIKSRDLQAFYRALMDDGVSGYMVRKLHILLKMAFKRAVIWEVIPRNPAEDIILPRVIQQERSAFTDIEAAKFMRACQADVEFTIFQFALETGLREQEYLALSWTDLDLEDCTARVRRAVGFNRNGSWEFKDPKTKNSARTVDFSPKLRDRLIEHRKHLENLLSELETKTERPLLLEHMKRKGTNFQKRTATRKNTLKTLAEFRKNDLVFPSVAGTPQSRPNVDRRLFKKAMGLAGLDPAKHSLNSLRHTHATIMARKIPPKQLQARMGHATIVTTLTYYVHVTDIGQKRASELLASVLYDRPPNLGPSHIVKATKQK
jgi:integrase